MEKTASLLRRFVEEIPADGLGAKGSWNWQPKRQVDKTLLEGGSPTMEYSSNEQAE